jgi:hypothetical protein
MPNTFTTKSDLPKDVQAEIDRILAIPATQRKASETAFLNARASHTANGIIETDSSGNILRCSGTTIPANSGAGFSKGCLFIKTDAVAGTSGLYVNVGTTASCDFRLVTNA